jgi:hypothetical protein
MKKMINDIMENVTNKTISTKEAYSLIDILIKMHSTSKADTLELVNLYSKIFDIEQSVIDPDEELDKAWSNEMFESEEE